MIYIKFAFAIIQFQKTEKYTIMDNNTINRFNDIYENNEWGYGSGEGSLKIHTVGYSKFIEEFIKKKKIATVVDMGCGDWQFSKDINWGNAQYHGFDIVHKVIDANIAKYAKENIVFSCYSGSATMLPSADLLIIKDVLQHLTNDKIDRIFEEFNRYKYCLITNCVNPRGKFENVDILDGEMRYLDLRLPPFNVAGKVVYTFTNKMNPIKKFIYGPKWRKLVLLIDNSAKV